MGYNLYIESHSEHSMKYETLNDAAKQPTLQGFMRKGNVNIWYFKDEFRRDAMMGHRFCTQHGLFPIDTSDLTKTHIKLGAIRANVVLSLDDLDPIFSIMQGEEWSPNGEARDLIKSLGLSHTSMSVGDIIEVDGSVYLVDSCGFVTLKNGME